MSFSGKVKDELLARTPAARHCQLAELAGVVFCCGAVSWEENECKKLEIYTENEVLARKYFTLLQKTFNIIKIKFKEENAAKKAEGYAITLCGEDGADRVGRALKLVREGKNFSISPIIVQNTCCKRAFIRGAFLAAGSISDPKKAYHLEMVFSEAAKAEWIRNMINSFLIDAKVVQRKKYFVVYVKEGSQIVDLLNIMEAHRALMEFENVRILKEVRNSVNRKVNCEAANISKTAQAAAKQMDDILYIKDHFGFDDLDDGLKEIAELRMEYPEATLKELGEMLSVPLGKSGVNHRLKRLGKIAENFRNEKEEEE